MTAIYGALLARMPSMTAVDRPRRPIRCRQRTRGSNWDISRIFVDVPSGPGLGIKLDEMAVANKVGHKWTNTESYDEDDGSVVDW